MKTVFPLDVQHGLERIANGGDFSERFRDQQFAKALLLIGHVLTVIDDNEPLRGRDAP